MSVYEMILLFNTLIMDPQNVFFKVTVIINKVVHYVIMPHYKGSVNCWYRQRSKNEV